MRYLTERTEIAKAINFKQYPVVRINTEDTDDFGIKGTNVCIDNGTFRDGNPYYIHAKIRSYNDERGFHITQGCSVLKNSFGYSDIEEMLAWANAPIIKKDQDVLLILDAPSKKTAVCMILRTGSRIDANCSTPLEIEQI